MIRGSPPDLTAKWYKTIKRSMDSGQTEAVLMKLPLGPHSPCTKRFDSRKKNVVKVDIGLSSQLDTFVSRQGVRWKISLVPVPSSGEDDADIHAVFCDFVYLIAYWGVPVNYSLGDPFEDSSE